VVAPGSVALRLFCIASCTGATKGTNCRPWTMLAFLCSFFASDRPILVVLLAIRLGYKVTGATAAHVPSFALGACVLLTTANNPKPAGGAGGRTDGI